MSSESKPNAQGADNLLEAALDQAIAVCGGDLRATISALMLPTTIWSLRSKN
jgi:hypothetical protein